MLDDSLFGDAEGLELNGLFGDDLQEPHLNGAENGLGDELDLDDLEDLLSAEEALQSSEGHSGEEPEGPEEAGSGLDEEGTEGAGSAPEDLETAEPAADLEDEEYQPDSGEQPGGLPNLPESDDMQTVSAQAEAEAKAPEETKYDITTESLDTPESEEESEDGDAMDEPEEEEDLVDPNNPVTRFVREACEVQDGEVTSARDIYIAYLRWCDDNFEPPMPQRSFGMILTQMGFHRRRRGRGRNWSWWGVGLINGKSGGEDDELDSDYVDDANDGDEPDDDE